MEQGGLEILHGNRELSPVSVPCQRLIARCHVPSRIPSIARGIESVLAIFMTIKLLQPRTQVRLPLLLQVEVVGVVVSKIKERDRVINMFH